jgi:uncharacterized protein YPO0396
MTSFTSSLEPAELQITWTEFVWHLTNFCGLGLILLLSTMRNRGSCSNHVFFVWIVLIVCERIYNTAPMISQRPESVLKDIQRDILTQNYLSTQRELASAQTNLSRKDELDAECRLLEKNLEALQEHPSQHSEAFTKSMLDWIKSEPSGDSSDLKEELHTIKEEQSSLKKKFEDLKETIASLNDSILKFADLL